MKKTLIEEIARIHKLTYGKVNENFISDIFQDKKGESNVVKSEDPKKANLVSDNVTDFMNTLQGIDYPLFQQKFGSMEYQKEIEAVQMGLILLGYKLPTHGVDGYFGPETAQAVKQYKQDNQITDKDELQEVEMMEPVPVSSVTSKFGEKRPNETHPGVDLAASSGTPVKSPANGTITVAGDTPRCGGTIVIKHDNGFQSGFCHIKDINVQKGQKISQGEVVGLSGGGAGDSGKGNSRGAHLHFTLRKDGQLINPLNYIGKEGGYDFNAPQEKTTGTRQNSEEIITPNMVDSMIPKLQKLNITPQELDNLTNKITTGGSTTFTDIDLSTSEGFRKYAQICQKFIDTRKPNLLGINGEMMARSAAKVMVNSPHRYVPPELALAQLALEGGIGNPKIDSVPIVTRNPFNVGNTSKSKHTFNSVQEGIDAYYKLIATNYLGNNKTASDLINKFVNHNNQNYVGNDTGRYEKDLNSIALQANRISKTIA